MSIAIEIEQKIQVTMPCISMRKGASSAEVEDCSSHSGFTMRIIKNENEHLSYRVSAFYKGMVEDLPHWSVIIAGKVNNSFRCVGSTTLELEPVSESTLAMQKTVNGKKESLWVDLSEEKNYYIYKMPPLSSKKVEDLVAKSMLFKTEDGKKPEMILYNKYGVFLRIKEELYYAGESEEFTQCVTRRAGSIRLVQPLEEHKQVENSPRSNKEETSNTTSSWRVRLPEKPEWHILELAEKRTEEGNVQIRSASWDGTSLTSIQGSGLQEEPVLS